MNDSYYLKAGTFSKIEKFPVEITINKDKVEFGKNFKAALKKVWHEQKKNRRRWGG